MKRGLSFAAVLAAAVGLLGFVAVYGVQAMHPDEGHEVVLHGWQVVVTQAVLLALALAAGAVCATKALRRLRRLEGEGLVFGPPALLVGVLVAGLCTAGATRAVERAQEHTAEAQALRAHYAAELSELEKHPPVIRSVRPAGAPELAALTAAATELGADWYDASKPRAVRGRDASTAVVVLTREHRVARVWRGDAVVRETVTRATDEAEALALMAADVGARHERIHGYDVLVSTASTDFGSVSTARFRRGLVVWQVRVAPMNQVGFSPVEVAATLATVVRASTR